MHREGDLFVATVKEFPSLKSYGSTQLESLKKIIPMIMNEKSVRTESKKNLEVWFKF